MFWQLLSCHEKQRKSWLRRMEWFLGGVLAWLWFDIFRIRRWTILKNLTIAFPFWAAEEKYRIARLSLQHLCYGFPELFRIPFLRKEDIGRTLLLHGESFYEEALKKGRGVLLLSLHLGGVDMGIAALSVKGLPLQVISKRFSRRITNLFWFKLRSYHGTRYIDAHGSKVAFEILSACKNNEAVIFVVDQFMGKPYGIEGTFFGKNTGTAKGLALFAIRTGAPVIPVYSYRDLNLNTHVVFGEEIPLELHGDLNQRIQVMTQRYNDKVQEIITECPEQWLWVHRRWKRFK